MKRLIALVLVVLIVLFYSPELLKEGYDLKEKFFQSEIWNEFLDKININDNFYLSAIITFVAIIIIEAKLTHTFLRKVFLSLIFILLAICLYIIEVEIYFTIFCLMLSIFPWLKHRSFSHSIFATIIVYFLLKQIELITNINNLSFYGTIGYASHMFLGDLFTKQGIPIFYPLSEKKISLGFLTVGGPFSNFIEKSFIFVLIGLIIFSILKL
ncbi:metal-dependent hydrolase [Clostridioides difficile]|uniref:metal-dependent hydrolase n=1 Tax=Clostridioides difficile TaxID=1496 RepID=UPI00254E1BA4|nr:metal-dependent hydrolase [Clostridioides difficile]MDL0257954.1 metal-dependent hydrolase [Clostridioides difficile]